MASIDETVRDLNAQRLKIWERGKELLDNALREGRTLTAEESQNYDALNDDISRLDKTRDALLSSERAQREYQEVQEEFQRVSTPIERESAARRDANLEEMFIRRGVGGENGGQALKSINLDLVPVARAFEAKRLGLTGDEFRAVFAGDTGTSGGSLTIPTTVAGSIYSYMTAQVAMRRIGCTIITTDGGNPMLFPKTVTHSSGTQVANQDTAFTQSVSVVGNMRLDAYDFGDLIPVSGDILEDSGVNVIDYVGRQIGRALGQVTATAYITGSGSSTVQGIQGAVTSGSGAGTVSSGGSLFGLPAGQELEKLIDVQYTVADSYRQNGAAWLMRDLTGARIRKIRDGAGGTAGQFVWQPSPTVGAIGGQPDTFLGNPVYFDPNVASMASNAKIVFYGDFSSYYIRDVRGIRLDRSDHLYFDKNQIAFRGLLRTDGDLLDNYAITCLTQNV